MKKLLRKLRKGITSRGRVFGGDSGQMREQIQKMNALRQEIISVKAVRG